MKLQFRQIEPFVKKPDPAARVILIYGPDDGLIRERARAIGGTVVDLERTAQTGTAGFGFSQTNEYGGGSTTAALTMRIETQETLSQGAVVPEATLRLDRAGQDTIVMPVSGLIGCA